MVQRYKYIHIQYNLNVIIDYASTFLWERFSLVKKIPTNIQRLLKLSSSFCLKAVPTLYWLAINCKFRFRYGVLRRDSNAFYN